jgi:hypothetical protein
MSVIPVLRDDERTGDPDPMSVIPVLQRPAPLARAFERIRSTGTATMMEDTESSERALLEALRPVMVSVWPEVAWRFGLLTATGYPVELAWASRDAALRWTCEVAGPETPEADRLTLAAQAAAVEVAPWAAVQRGRRLRYGAWLGMRQLDGVRRAKVYLELPTSDLAPGPWAEAGRDLAHRVLDLTWRIAGVNDDGSVELYARVPELSWVELGNAARLVGDRGPLVDLVRELIRRPYRWDADLPRPSGLSLVLSSSGTPVALTWFTVAKWVWPDDAAVSAAVLRTTALVVHRSASRGLYRALSSGPDDGRWRHGMVGVGVDLAGGTSLQAGLRPT